MATQPPMSGSDDPDTPNCSFNSLSGASYAVFIDLTTSAQDVVSQAAGESQGEVDVDGFVVPLLSAAGTSGCSGFVDTGEGQYLSVQANGTGQIAVADLCQLVPSAVKIVLDNLESMQPS